jgi:hypothetical protein
MADTTTSPAKLRTAIDRAGYYPAFVAESIETAAGGEVIDSYVVHLETTFDQDEVRRHVTVLALTPTRLIIAHTDEHPPEEGEATSFATTSTEAIRLDRISSVVLTRTVDDPARHVRGAPPREVVLTIGWGGVSRIDLEPAACSDPNCDADHGYTGTVSADDMSLRVSAAADGPEIVTQLLHFASALSTATGRS